MKLLQLFAHQDDKSSKIEAYLHLKAQNTQRHYKQILQEFYAVTGGCLTVESVLGWADYVLQQPGSIPRRPTSAPMTCTEATLLHKAVVIKGFLQFCGDDTQSITWVTRRTRRAETGSKRQTEALTAEEVQRVFETWAGNDLKSARNGALMALLFGGGLRISEAINIRFGDILEGQDSIVWLNLTKTKNKQRRDQVLPLWAAQLVLKYISKFPPDSGRYLFAGQKPEQPVTSKTAYRWVKEAFAEAHLPTQIYSPHSARATAITQLLRQGYDYNQVRIFAGHSSFTQVARYDKRLKSHESHPGLKLSYKK